MENISKHIPIVKDQFEFHQKQADRFHSSPFRSNLHRTTAERMGELLTDMLAEEQKAQEPKTEGSPEESAKDRPPIQLALSPEELDGLPQELLDELTGADKTEFAIISAIEEAGGIITLDRLLIAVYRKTGEVLKREVLTSRLYRMGQKNLVFNVPGKKGVYSNEQLSADDAAKLLGSPLKQKS